VASGADARGVLSAEVRLSLVFDGPWGRGSLL